MNNLLISPLAPAAIFLAGSLFVIIVFRQLWPQLQNNRWLRSTVSLLITGSVFLILAYRIVSGLPSDVLFARIVFSAWDGGAGLTIRLDTIGLPFLFIPTLLLIAAFWARQVINHGTLLGLAGGAAVVFVAANALSISYALCLFDLFGCIYWFRTKQPNLGLARLFLAIFTTATFLLAGLNSTMGSVVLIVALWLRLGLFPFIEISAWTDDQLKGAEGMIWLALSTVVGLYLSGRSLTAQSYFPVGLKWLIVVTILITAWLAWLGDKNGIAGRRKLLRFILIQPALGLLVAPLSIDLFITLGLGYTLGLGALWLTPHIGKPNLLERHWPWLYAAPILATLSLIGVPFTFGWVTHHAIYNSLLSNNQLTLAAIVLLAQGLAFSALYQYWQVLLAGHLDNQNKLDAYQGTVADLQKALFLTIPFLLPGVAGLTFSVITRQDFATELTGQGLALLTPSGMALLLIWGLAIGFGYNQDRILTWLHITPPIVSNVLVFNWLWPYIEDSLSKLNQTSLYFKSILEGRHYLGWAFLITLAGILVVVLS